MAGIVVHLAVADRILEKLPKGTITDTALFIAGNIAPDAIHARADYERRMKKQVHFTNDIRIVDIMDPDNHKIYLSRINSFVEKYYDADSRSADLYRGYISHILTDDAFRVYEDPDAVRRYKELGIDKSMPEYQKAATWDMDIIDRRLAGEYPFKHEIIALLKSVDGYEITDYITADELRRSKAWVINRFFESSHESEEPAGLSYDYELRFVEKACDYVIKNMSSGENFKKMI